MLDDIRALPPRLRGQATPTSATRKSPPKCADDGLTSLVEEGRRRMGFTPRQRQDGTGTRRRPPAARLAFDQKLTDRGRPCLPARFLVNKFGPVSLRSCCWPISLPSTRGKSAPCLRPKINLIVVVCPLGHDIPRKLGPKKSSPEPNFGPSLCRGYASR